MRITKPERVVEVCDICHGEGFLKTCPVCGKQFCLVCEGIMAGCWVGPDVCQRCSRRSDVREAVELYAKRITPIIRERTAALKALSVESPE